MDQELIPPKEFIRLAWLHCTALPLSNPECFSYGERSSTCDVSGWRPILPKRNWCPSHLILTKKKKETNKPTKEKEKKITNEQLLFLQGVILSSVDLVHQVENVFLHCRPVLSRPSVRCCIPNVRFCALTPQVKSLWMDHILSMQRRGRKVNGKSVQSQQFAMVYNGQPTTARHWPAAQVSLTNLYGCRACG